MSATNRCRMHANSLLAFHQGKQELFSKRELEVLVALRKLGSATDREVMIACDFTDMNSVRPRLTELIKDGVIEECGMKMDPVTDRQVRLVRVKADPRLPRRERTSQVWLDLPLAQIGGSS